ncbi:unnamed protein product [Mesocestoides corti]|uniref:Uncharacterized protein n=1 Tax=Mesocestoides corti TaxID=53468 RepID=A0A0R3U1N8_MESCO|nr:unnamed protein product [Mesocestoides corti]
MDSGHLTFQCRNYLRAGAAGNIDLDIESTSSDSDADELLKEAIERRKAELGMSPHCSQKELEEKAQVKQKAVKIKKSILIP